MPQGIQEQSFLDGFAVGQLTGRLKHQAPDQLKEWVPLAKLNDFKGVLRKYNYSITGLTADPSDPTQVLMVAEKMAPGTDENLVQAFTQSDRFMDGWATGCLHSFLHYVQPKQVEEWVKLNNLDAVQQVLEEYGYKISSLQVHSKDKRWAMLSASKKSA